MKRIIAALLGLGLILPLCACQPTPQKGVVVQKNSERMIENAQKDESENTGKSLAEQYGIPEEYTFEKAGKDGKLNIKVNARVIVPEGSVMPIYRVRAADFTQELVSAVFHELCGDKQMWYQREIEEYSKSEIEGLILSTTKDMNATGYGKEVTESLSLQLEYYKRLYQKAPDTPKKERCYGELRQVNELSGTGELIRTYASVRAMTDGEHFSTFDAANNSRDITVSKQFFGNQIVIPTRDAFILYHDGRVEGQFGQHADLRLTDMNHTPDSTKGLTITPQEAVHIAAGFFETVGIGEEYIVDSVFLTDDENLGNYDGKTGPAEHYAYRLYCVRKVNETPCTYMRDMSSSAVDDGGFAPQWWYESLEMLVDDEGVFSMQWYAPLEIMDCVNEDAQLKPFSEVREIFEKMIFIKYEDYAKDYDSFVFEIDRATLSLQRIAEQNSIENGLLVPVWNFYGTLTREVNGKKEVGGLNGPGTINSSVLSINAIDGSIIDISKGY